MEKLNLEWVTDIIGEDYKKWNMEDRHIMNNRNNVFIETQTGTGKTKFIIDKIVPLVNQSIRNKRKLNLLIVCNRINLKRQVKLELLKSNLDLYEFDKDIKKICNSDNTENNIKETFQILDKLSKITNGITVMSYQQLGEIIYYNNFYCNQHKNNLNFFDFIVFDECHFMLSDLEFNTKCNLIFNELVLKEYSNSFRIFLSATLYELKNAIDFNARLENSRGEARKNNCNFNIYTFFNQYISLNHTNNFKEKTNLNNEYEFSTGRDYSYLDVKYFKNIEDIIIILKNHFSANKDKWLIFVSKIKDAQYIKERLKSEKISIEIFKSGSNTKEAENIVHNSSFKCDVLISTKVLDNGINLKDKSIRNLVVMELDKTTFIQEIGRIRVDIKNPHKINLFIPMKNKKTFSFLKRRYDYKVKKIEKFSNSTTEFYREHNLNFQSVPQELFYLYGYANTQLIWAINPLGLYKLAESIKFTDEMIKKFTGEPKVIEHSKNVKVDNPNPTPPDNFAFVKKQLEWLGLENTFNEANLINLDSEIVDSKEITILKNYLDKNLDKKLYKDEQQELSNFITEELKTVYTKKDYRSKKLNLKTINKILLENNLLYKIERSKGCSYWIIYKS